VTAPPPRPPALDAGRAEACRARLAAVLKPALGQLAAGPLDGFADAGCRIFAGMLADVGRAYAVRNTKTIERYTAEVERFARVLPDRLTECRRPATWQAEDRECCQPEPRKRRWGRK
jgi:hypothetical protein